jgi:hypothetical protein
MELALQLLFFLPVQGSTDLLPFGFTNFFSIFFFSIQKEEHHGNKVCQTSTISLFSDLNYIIQLLLTDLIVPKSMVAHKTYG